MNIQRLNEVLKFEAATGDNWHRELEPFLAATATDPDNRHTHLAALADYATDNDHPLAELYNQMWNQDTQRPEGKLPDGHTTNATLYHSGHTSHWVKAPSDQHPGRRVLLQHDFQPATDGDVIVRLTGTVLGEGEEVKRGVKGMYAKVPRETAEAALRHFQADPETSLHWGSGKEPTFDGAELREKGDWQRYPTKNPVANLRNSIEAVTGKTLNLSHEEAPVHQFGRKLQSVLHRTNGQLLLSLLAKDHEALLDESGQHAHRLATADALYEDGRDAEADLLKGEGPVGVVNGRVYTGDHRKLHPDVREYIKHELASQHYEPYGPDYELAPGLQFGEVPIDTHYELADVHPLTVAKLNADYSDFRDKHERNEGELAPHHFLESRSGIWDGFNGHPELYGDKRSGKLHREAQKLGPVDLKVENGVVKHS